MSLDYDKIRQNIDESASSKMASYSDLFMVLSFVFLLLYVVASIRNGAFSIQKNGEFRRLAREAADLKQQIRVYNALKDDHLEKKATSEEQKAYEELMDKLSLLKENAKDEKEKLRKLSIENERKENALNKYQQLVRNIINTNILAKGRIKRRDKIIVTKKEVINVQAKDIHEKKALLEQRAATIAKNQQMLQKKEILIQKNKQILDEKSNEIVELKDSVSSKKATINANKKLIATINSDIKNKVTLLEKLKQNQQISEEKFQKRIKRLQEESELQVAKINEKNQTMSQNLAQINAKLFVANTELNKANKSIKQQIQEQQKLAQNLEEAKNTKIIMEQAHARKLAQVEDRIQAQKSKFAAQKERDKQVFLKQLRSQKMSAKARAKKLAEFKARSRKKEMALKDKINKISGDLKKAQDIINMTKVVTRNIVQNFKKKGIDAKVDKQTGDVILNFGQEYFTTGASKLKPAMRTILRKFMPAYSESLFKDAKIAKKIKSVEIVGFSSPTYKGRYVDPKSLKASDRAAISYNLDLSFYRAKSIFNYIFDKSKMEYKHQKTLLPLVKVTGRSFLAEGIKGRNIASGMGQKQYCKKYNCKKSQRVIIKFNLKN
ncbi:MAG: hypothetical protein ISR65_08960 [Bacteriovoracaceae bacterium]|nr:hypothetical protein [Bacteriovoracaceae bacterium]